MKVIRGGQASELSPQQKAEAMKFIHQLPEEEMANVIVFGTPGYTWSEDERMEGPEGDILNTEASLLQTSLLAGLNRSNEEWVEDGFDKSERLGLMMTVAAVYMAQLEELMADFEDEGGDMDEEAFEEYITGLSIPEILNLLVFDSTQADWALANPDAPKGKTLRSSATKEEREFVKHLESLLKDFKKTLGSIKPEHFQYFTLLLYETSFERAMADLDAQSDLFEEQEEEPLPKTTSKGAKVINMYPKK